jgi:hypothetical protein
MTDKPKTLAGRREMRVHTKIAERLVGRTIESVSLSYVEDEGGEVGFRPLIRFTDGSTLAINTIELEYMDAAARLTLHEKKAPVKSRKKVR